MPEHPPSSIPVLAGPTASGKSSLALRLAARFPLELISADAMQVYRGMDIGTAKPTAEEQARVPHHLIDIVNPDEAFSVAAYVTLAEAAIGDVLARGHIPLVVGGTGFYIRALTQGLPTVPEADAEMQKPLWEVYEREGLASLQAELESFSPQDAERAQRNPRRVIRALEIIHRTGHAPSSFGFTKPAFNYDKVALLPDIQALTKRIERRTEVMFKTGLVEEVKRLLEAYPDRPTATQAIGYKEVVDYLEGKLSLVEANIAVSLATVQYAKRQRTWFRKESGMRLISNLGDNSEAEAQVVTGLEALKDYLKD